jgi:hypothetical protein
MLCPSARGARWRPRITAIAAPPARAALCCFCTLRVHTGCLPPAQDRSAVQPCFYDPPHLTSQLAPLRNCNPLSLRSRRAARAHAPTHLSHLPARAPRRRPSPPTHPSRGCRTPPLRNSLPGAAGARRPRTRRPRARRPRARGRAPVRRLCNRRRPASSLGPPLLRQQWGLAMGSGGPALRPPQPSSHHGAPPPQSRARPQGAAAAAALRMFGATPRARPGAAPVLVGAQRGTPGGCRDLTHVRAGALGGGRRRATPKIAALRARDTLDRFPRPPHVPTRAPYPSPAPAPTPGGPPPARAERSPHSGTAGMGKRARGGSGGGKRKKAAIGAPESPAGPSSSSPSSCGGEDRPVRVYADGGSRWEARGGRGAAVAGARRPARLRQRAAPRR